MRAGIDEFCQHLSRASRHRQSGHLRVTTACLFSADIVAKVENRMTPKILRKPIFRDSCSRNALLSQYEGRWSFWYETMWSLKSPRAKRISGL
jgi:hypothetical protein